MATTTVVRPAPKATSISSARIMVGMARNTFRKRWLMISKFPLTYPVITPQMNPTPFPRAHRCEGDQQGDARSEDDPGEDVSAKEVGSEPMVARRGVREHLPVRFRYAIRGYRVCQQGERRPELPGRRVRPLPMEKTWKTPETSRRPSRLWGRQPRQPEWLSNQVSLVNQLAITGTRAYE